MISSLAGRIVHFLKKNGEIKEENEKLLIYGLTQGFRMCLNMVTTLLIGALMGMWWQGFLFLAAFIPIRSFAGGYHAKTPLRCYWYSVAIVAVSLEAVRHAAVQFVDAAALCSVLAIFFLAPVESEKKYLSDAEKNSLRKKARLALYAGLACMAAFSMSGLSEASRCIKMAIAVAGLLVMTGGWKNSHGKHSSMRG